MQNFDLGQTLQAMAQDPNEQTRTAARNILLKSMNLNIEQHQLYSNFLINNQQNSSVQMIAILFLKNFIEKSAVQDEKKFESHSQELILLYTNCYYQLQQSSISIIQQFAETLKEMFTEDFNYQLLKEYLVKVLSSENCTGYQNLTKTSILTTQLVTKFSCQVYQDFNFVKQLFIQILDIGNLLLNEIYQNLNNQQTQLKLECLLYYFKLLYIFIDLRNYNVSEKQVVIVQQIQKVLQLNLNDQNSLEQQDQQMIFNNQENQERALLRRTKKKCLKIFQFISKKNFKRIQEEKSLLEFIVRSLQNILFEQTFYPTDLTEKILCNSIEILKLHVKNVNHYTLFDINKTMIFNNIIISYVKTKSINFDNLQDDPEKFIADLEDCYCNHYIIQNGFRSSTELYITMCNTIKEFFNNTFGQMIREFQKVITKSQNEKITKDDIFKIHTIMTVFVCCSEIDDFGPQQDYKVFELVHRNFEFLCQNVYTAVSVLSIFQNLSVYFFQQDKISQQDKQNYANNNINLVMQFMNYDSDTLQQIKSFKLIEYLSSKTLNEENPQLFLYIKQNSTNIITNIFNKVINEKDQSSVKMVRHFVRNFCQDVSKDNLFNILSQLKQVLINEQEFGLFLEFFNLFEEIYEHGLFNKEQIEQIDQIYQDCYNLLWSVGGKKDLSEDHMLNAITNIIIKNQYTSNTHLEMLAGLYKIINRESFLYYRNFLMATIKFSDSRFTNYHFVETLRLIHPFIKDQFGLEILYYLIVQKNSVINQESANFIWSMMEPVYNILTNFDINYRALLVLCYLNIVLIFNNQDFIQNKVQKVSEIIKMHVLKPQNIFFEQYQRQNAIISVVNLVIRPEFIMNFHDQFVKISIFCIDQLKSLQICGSNINKYPEALKMKAKKNHYYDDIISDSGDDSDEEDIEQLNEFENISNKRYKNSEKKFKIELPNEFGDAELAFKNFLIYIKKDQQYYEQFLSLIPFNYEEDIQKYSQLQKVVIDQEKGITENRRIIKIKRKNKQQLINQ